MAKPGNGKRKMQSVYNKRRKKTNNFLKKLFKIFK